MRFQELNIIEPILKALATEGYETPTPIQTQAIPPLLQGRDILGCAQTGTGKTATFAIPILQLFTQKVVNYNEKRKIKALILTPTRELALQIFESFKTYGSFTKLKYGVIFGGVSQKPQELTLSRGLDILVATPGRLNDLLNQGKIDLRYIEIFVLDEADRMLDMGFINDVKKIIKKIPIKRQTMLFSATIPPEINMIAKTILINPVTISVTPVSSAVDTVKQALYYVDKGNKQSLLKFLLNDKSIKSALVFTRTKHGADKVVRDLLKSQIVSAAIHGNKSQNARQLALNNFKNGLTRVLVATDIAARGIDIDELSHVINYDLPNIPETYVHRIGRTGRAGLKGVAISFCDFDEKPFLADIERLLNRKIDVVTSHPFPLLITTPTRKVTNQNQRKRK
ncbi:MAG: DEAD/DEAH box helicase [Erysipelotrichaceae bacterium]|nr:DEAD/DEAH box helicase [Erysipelotrichaceae bacterium]